LYLQLVMDGCNINAFRT